MGLKFKKNNVKIKINEKKTKKLEFTKNTFQKTLRIIP